MAISNHERVGKALELLNAGLMPFFARELQSAYGDSWEETVRGNLSDRQGGRASNWDTTAMIGIMIGHWDQVFRRQLGGADRTLLHECRDIRNRWAHISTPSPRTTPTAPSTASSGCCSRSGRPSRPRRSTAKSRRC
jgi:hypothetical protein